MKNGTTTLQTERLLLRPFTLTDAPDMFKNYCNDAVVCKYVTWGPHETLENTKLYLQKIISQYPLDYFYTWAVVLKETGQVIGSIDIKVKSVNMQLGEFGWVVGREFWGKGLMTECAKCVLEYAKTQDFKKLVANYAQPNVGSGKVMKKLGLTYDATYKDAAKCWGGVFDKVSYYITF